MPLKNLSPTQVGVLITALLLLWPLQLLFERKPWCLSSGLIEQVLYINSEGLSHRLLSCSQLGWLKTTPPLLEDRQRLVQSLGQIHSLRPLEGVLGLPHKPLTVILRWDRPEAFHHRGRVLEVGGQWLEGGQFKQALLKAWLGQLEGQHFYPLETELLAGFWQRFLDGSLDGPLSHPSPYWLELQSLDSYCLNHQISPQFVSYCARHNSHLNVSELRAGAGFGPHIWSLLPWLQERMWQVYQGKRFTGKGQFLGRWQEEVRPWLRALGEISELLSSEDPLPLSLSHSRPQLSFLRETHFTSGESVGVTWLRSFEPLGSGEKEALHSWALRRPPSQITLVSFAGTLPEVFHLPSMRPVEFFSHLELNIREQVWLSCHPLPQEMLLEALAWRVHWVEYCPESASEKASSWSRLVSQESWADFLRQETSLNFISFHPSSVQLAAQRGTMGDSDVRTLSDLYFWSRAMAWEGLLHQKRLKIFEPQAKIDGVTHFRLEVTGDMGDPSLLRELPVVDVNRRSRLRQASPN